MKTFEELGLSESLLRAIGELGFETPMPIQEEVIPFLIEGDSDVIALAQTGTGKTAAYGLPILQKLDLERRCPQSLVLSPTRELCIQIADDMKDFARYMEGVSVMPVYGGSSIKNQIEGLRRGVQVIVATPGRLLDLMNRGHVDLSAVHNVVLDEADEMLDMGFSEDLDAILAAVPEDRNTLFFSATMPEEIEKLSVKYMREPHEIVIGKKNESTASVRHICYTVKATEKYQTLKRIVDYYPRIYGIIFCRTKAETQEISDKLIHDGYNADALHGDLSQMQRDYVMQRFRIHNIQLLVATDVAARGIDVDDLTHIINYTLPDEDEVYNHRSGRTGRAGKTGISIAIINMRETRRIRAIEKTIGKTFETGKIPTGKEICSKQIFNLMDRIEKVEVNEDEIADILPSVYGKLEWLDKEELIKRMVSLEFNRIISYYQENEDFEASTGREERRFVEVTTEKGYKKVFVNVGKMDGTTPKSIIGLVNSCNPEKVAIGRIDIFTRYTLIDVPESLAERVVEELGTLKMRGRAIKAFFATDEQISRGSKAKAEFQKKREERREERREKRKGERRHRKGDRKQ